VGFRRRGFDDLEYSFDIGYSGEAQGRLIICDVVSPLRFTVLDPDICARVAATMADDDAAPVRVTSHRPVSRPAALRLKRTIGYVRDAFPNSTDADTTAEDQHDASPGTLRRAVAFIEANPDADISVSDIARAAYVTPRAVRLAFRHHLDTTPTYYPRRVRLEHARQDLAQASPRDGTTVTAVAYRWGLPAPAGSPLPTAPPSASSPATRCPTYSRRDIPVTTHARPRALQYKATMTRTKACCSAPLWVFARRATASPSCTG